jgi:hypothetical protein
MTGQYLYKIKVDMVKENGFDGIGADQCQVTSSWRQSRSRRSAESSAFSKGYTKINGHLWLKDKAQ